MPRTGYKKDFRKTYVTVGNLDLVPDRFYPLDILLSKKPYNLSAEEIHNIRLACYQNTKSIVGKDNAVSVRQYWNANVAEFEKDVNVFLTIKPFEPIAHRVMMFEKNSEDNPRNRQATKKMSFGILKSEHDNFLKTGKVPEKITKLANDEETAVKYAYIVPGNGLEVTEKIKTRKVPEVQLWKTWCKANGYKQSEAIIAAMKLQMEHNPGKVELPPIEDFMDGRTVDDYTYELPQKYIGDKRRIQGRYNLDRATMETTKTMLVRYNRYAELTGGHRFTMQEYFERALIMFNNAMIKKLLPYSREYKEYEKDLAYYERMKDKK